MLKQRFTFRFLTLFLLSLMIITPVRAETEVPKDVITRTANELLGIIGEARGYYDTDPQRFYDKVEAILEPSIDMRRFAAGVMAKYYRVADADQRKRFLEVFKGSMIRTYAKGLLAFSNEEIRVLDPKAPSRDPDRDTVEMEVIAVDGTVYPIIYAMRKGKDNQWRITNVTVNGINLGLTFRNQFDSAMQAHNRNFDYVIENWLKSESASVVSEGKVSEVVSE
ncbi:MlaC/ttg2D family ABC transporter substrate-binding protein [Oceanospirillum maris]|uniref:MlaC/ttg2D family ABC transporter substrate-binding protein n=1 Tax=Oceanospirillum maris TaxID=64977 RepID=UPI00042539A4|nr:ABC transporter substrate-binding protein [Oceanospirillum maris]